MTAAKPTAKKKTKPKAAPRRLTAQQERFAREYLLDLNATQAAIRASYSQKTAHVLGHDLLKNPLVAAHIKVLQDERAKEVDVTAAMVLQRLWMIATADPNELIEYRRRCCRHCYGKNNAYQWRDSTEFSNAVEAGKKEDPPRVPINAGGFGFSKLNAPNERCPVCEGEGVEDVYPKDTRLLTPQARALYAGVKMTKQGLEIKTHDQLAALTNVARHLGMFNDKVTIKGDANNPLLVMLGQLAGKTIRPVADPDHEENS